MQTHSYPRELTLIPRPPEQVIGRAKQLKTIHENLDNYKAPIVLVNGIGGIGKTTVALEFIQQHGAAYPHLAWIEVTDTIPAAMVANKTLLKNLQLEAELETLPPDTYEAQAFDLIINKLNQLPGCLLVIDNANNLDDLLRCEQRLRSLNAKTLLTSRAQPGDWTTVPIDELEPHEAFELFLLYYGTKNAIGKTDLVYKILECLQHHTLLVELVAKAAFKANLSLETLYEKVQRPYLSDKTLNLKQVKPETHADHTKLPKQARIEHYITLVFQQISTLSDPEQRYLRYMTLLSSNEYAESFLLDIFTYQPEEKENERNPKILATDTKLEIIDTLEALAQKGWLTQKRDAQGCTYKLHGVIQEVAIQELKLPYEAIEFFVKYIKDQLYIDRETKNFFEKFVWIPFAEHLLAIITDTEHASYADLQHWLAWLIYQTGEYKKAKALLESAKEISERTLDLNHPDIGRNYSTLGIICQDLGEYQTAATYLEKAVENALLAYGEKHPNVAVSQSNLANVYGNLGQNERARDLLEKALASDIENFGEKHPSVALRQSNLASVYGDLGDYERARDLLEKALASDIENFGEKHPTVARCQSNLAYVYRKLGQYERARDLLEKALASDIENFGEKHPNVATRYNNLIELYVYFQEWDKAQEACDKNLAIRMQVLGAEHPATKLAQDWRDWLEAQRSEQSEQ